MVGSPQDIQCTVSTVSGVELSSVMISWTGPGGDTITNDSRVTITSTSNSGNNYTSSLQFMYLMEEDEGTYECNVMILETYASHATKINNVIGKIQYSILKMSHLWLRTCTVLTSLIHSITCLIAAWKFTLLEIICIYCIYYDRQMIDLPTIC